MSPVSGSPSGCRGSLSMMVVATSAHIDIVPCHSSAGKLQPTAAIGWRQSTDCQPEPTAAIGWRRSTDCQPECQCPQPSGCRSGSAAAGATVAQSVGSPLTVLSPTPRRLVYSPLAQAVFSPLATAGSDSLCTPLGTLQVTVTVVVE
jgi:hypothetical protein